MAAAVYLHNHIEVRSKPGEAKIISLCQGKYCSKSKRPCSSDFKNLKLDINTKIGTKIRTKLGTKLETKLEDQNKEPK